MGIYYFKDTCLDFLDLFLMGGPFDSRELMFGLFIVTLVVKSLNSYLFSFPSWPTAMPRMGWIGRTKS